MRNSEEFVDWYSLENIDVGGVDFEDLKNESDWFRIETNECGDPNYLESGASESLIWNISLRFKSITLQNPATIIFKAPNWNKVVRGSDEIPKSKCPKTHPPIPCRRSTTVFSDPEIEISSKVICSWREIFERLNCEPLVIEACKVTPFGDQEPHSSGYVNLKHILIQTEKTNPKVVGTYVFGSSTFRIWPTRILLYPTRDPEKSKDGTDLGISLKAHPMYESELETDPEIKAFVGSEKDSTSSLDEKNTPIGLVEVDVILQDCQKLSISDTSPTHRRRALEDSGNFGREPRSPTKSVMGSESRPSSASRSRSASRSLSASRKKNGESPRKRPSRRSLRAGDPKSSPGNRRVGFSSGVPQNTLEDLGRELEFEEVSPELFKASSFIDGLKQMEGIYDFSSKMEYFTVGDSSFSKKLMEKIVSEVDATEEGGSAQYYNSGSPNVELDEEQSASLAFEVWKKVEKERFIQHLQDLEEEFRKITLIRQETIMREFIKEIKRKSNNLGRLENLVSTKILNLKNKENSINNVGEENNRKMKLFQFEQKKIYEVQKNELCSKLEMEKKKTQIVEFEKNKWLKKYNQQEEINQQLTREIQSLKTGRKSDLYFKNELLRKDELIKSYEDQISQYRETIQLLKSSRNHYKTQFDQLATAAHLFPEQNSRSDSAKAISNAYTHNVDSLLQSGLYSEEDQFIQLLKSRQNPNNST
ncbi:hypothetical protein HWI79_1601 [Cryptosporidium felis]|nr:hypothetical protein HWI79_1601 [Cryptosporidium felis]